RHGEAIALRTLGSFLRGHGELERALDVLATARDGYEASGDTVGCWQATRLIGQTHLDLGHLDDALRIMRDAERLAEATGAGRLIAQTGYWLGNVHLARGDLAAARDRFRYVLGVVGDSDVTGQAYAVHGVAEVARLAGDLIEAQQLLTDATQLARQA